METSSNICGIIMQLNTAAFIYDSIENGIPEAIEEIKQKPKSCRSTAFEINHMLHHDILQMQISAFSQT